jgi:hypothetical protein
MSQSKKKPRSVTWSAPIFRGRSCWRRRSTTTKRAVAVRAASAPAVRRTTHARVDARPPRARADLVAAAAHARVEQTLEVGGCANMLASASPTGRPCSRSAAASAGASATRRRRRSRSSATRRRPRRLQMRATSCDRSGRARQRIRGGCFSSTPTRQPRCRAGSRALPTARSRRSRRRSVTRRLRRARRPSARPGRRARGTTAAGGPQL